MQADDGRVCFRRPVSTWSSPLGCRVPVAPSLSEHASLFTRDYPYKITASLTVLIEDWDHPVGIERQKLIWREEGAEYCTPRNYAPLATAKQRTASHTSTYSATVITKLLGAATFLLMRYSTGVRF